MEKILWDDPKWGWEGLIQTLPTFLGDMDLEFDNLYVLYLFGHCVDSKFLEFHVPRFP